MKEQVQELGVRKWFGDDFIELQNELAAAIRSIVSDYGNMIVSGCTITNNGNNTYNISDGIAYLRDSTGSNGRFCRVYAQANIQAVNFPIYIVQDTKDRTSVPDYGREYKDGVTKNIIVEYYGKIETNQPAHSNYVSITSAGVTTRLRDAIQNSSYRFVTDAQINGWNAKLAAAAYTAADVLAKMITVDGAGSGLDADLLDGKHASAFATAAQGTKADAALPASDYTAADILTKIKTVDGAASGLDADLLDGKHASEFATSAQGTKADNAQPAADCVSTNTANKAVKRDASGNFSAGTITVTDIIIT